ncbi:MAG: hypothetical protein LBG14_03330 [Treponema sp.]|jgi:hypothetical protein|nr:hypothetical protein [Treponema sp.]
MKNCIAGLVIFIAGMGLGAQETPIALLEDSWMEPGRVTEMLALHDLQGGVYIPSIAGNAFRVLRAGAGERLGPYAPEGFDGVSPAARNLKAISDGSERYLAFIGRRDGVESVCLFGFGFWDALSYYPLAETEAEAIRDYDLVPTKGGGLTVYTLAGGRLRSFSTIKRGDTLWQEREISRPGEQAEAFGVLRERNQEISYGWYRIARKDYWEINLFSVNGAGNLVVEQTGSWSHAPRLEYGVSPEGKAVFTITAGSAVSVFHAEGPRFVRDLIFNAPFAAKRYSPALLRGGSPGLLIGEAEGTDVLYGVSHERSGAPALRELFARPSAEILELFLTGNNRISLIYRVDQILGAALLHTDGGIIADRPLPVSSGGAALFRQPPEENRVYALSRASPAESFLLSMFEFEGETWRPAGETRVSRFFPEKAHSPLGIRDEELLLMSSPEALMLYETETSKSQILEMENYALSNALNGVVYLAVSSEKGISLYRIGE